MTKALQIQNALRLIHSVMASDEVLQFHPNDLISCGSIPQISLITNLPLRSQELSTYLNNRLGDNKPVQFDDLKLSIQELSMIDDSLGRFALDMHKNSYEKNKSRVKYLRECLYGVIKQLQQLRTNNHK